MVKRLSPPLPSPPAPISTTDAGESLPGSPVQFTTSPSSYVWMAAKEIGPLASGLRAWNRNSSNCPGAMAPPSMVSTPSSMPMVHPGLG
jgi:hypothetical protein